VGLSALLEGPTQNLESEVVFVLEAASTFLDCADLVVEAFDEPESDFVVGMAVRDDAGPVILEKPSDCRTN
jgi:hypothetical protein